MKDKTRKIIKKIAKLKAMSEGAEEIGSHAEAAAFAAEVQRLCSEYNLSLEQVELERESHEGIGDSVWGDVDDFKTRRTWWEHELSILVARGHNCQSLASKGSNYVWFVGRTVERECAVWVYDVLLKYVKRGVRNSYVRARRDGLGTDNFYTDYYRGFLAAIGKRYEDESRRQRMTVPYSQSLAITRPDEGIDRWLVDRDISEGNKGPKRPGKKQNKAAFETGFGDGLKAPIRSRGLSDVSNSNNKKLEDENA